MEIYISRTDNYVAQFWLFLLASNTAAIRFLEVLQERNSAYYMSDIPNEKAIRLSIEVIFKTENIALKCILLLTLIISLKFTYSIFHFELH